MSQYIKGYVYKLYSPKSPNKFYIGSTTNSLKGRLFSHMANYENYLQNPEGKGCCSSFEILQHTGEPKIELLEEIELDKNKISFRVPLVKRERYYIEKFKQLEGIECVNKRLPSRSQKEWKNLNREHLAEYKKQYYENNKEKELAYQKEYYQKNREKRLLQMKMLRLKKIREAQQKEEI